MKQHSRVNRYKVLKECICKQWYRRLHKNKNKRIIVQLQNDDKKTYLYINDSTKSFAIPVHTPTYLPM